MIKVEENYIKSSRVRVQGGDTGSAFALLEFEKDGSEVSVFFYSPEQMIAIARQLMAGAKTLSQFVAEDE